MNELPYDLERDPANPYFEIDIESPKEGARVNVRLYVDSGSTTTCIPRHHLNSLGKLHSGSIRARSFTGDEHTIQTYWVNVIIQGSSHLVEVIPLNEEYGLLGRDIINLYSTLLVGPGLQWTISQMSP